MGVGTLAIGVIVMTNFVRRAAGPTVVGAVAILWVLFSSVTRAQAPAPPEPPKTWTGAAGAGVSMTSGNRDTMK